MRDARLYLLRRVAAWVWPSLLLVLLVGSLSLAGLTLPHSLRVMIPFSAFVAVVLFAALALRPGIDPLLFLTAASLCGLGLLANFRLNPLLAGFQALWGIVGMLLFLLLLILLKDVAQLGRYKYIWAAGGLLLLGSSLLFGVERGGARLWIAVGPYSFQPSEVAKVLLGVFFAAYLAGAGSAFSPSSLGKRLSAYRAVLGPLGLVWGGVVLLFLLEKDLGTPAVLFITFLAVWYAATGRVWLALFSAVALGGALYWASSLFPHHLGHVMSRIHGWADPWGTVQTAGHQVAMSLFSVADGGLLGRGFGQGRPELVPAASTDFIFDVFAEELGLAGGAALILLSALLGFLCFRIALRAADTFPRLLAVALGAQLSIQALVILGGNLRALPITGVTLPFVSRGGSSLIASFLALGLVTAVGRLPTLRPPTGVEETALDAWSRRRWALDRALLCICRVSLLCFLGMILLHFYWGAIAAPRLAMHPANPRSAERVAWVKKGRILDRSGTVLVESRLTPSGYVRAYPQGGSEFLHVVGYDSPVYKQTGIERAFYGQLLGASKHLQVGWNGVEADSSPSDVQLTLDAGLQRLAQRLLRGKRGAAVVLDPRTGEILALASSPSFSPEGLEEKWQDLVQDEDKPFINRATAGLYPPGSAFKVFTLSAALANGTVSSDDVFTCKGKEKVAGTTVVCHQKGGHGRISLRKAFTESCNIAFAKIGVRLGAERFERMAQALLLGQRIDLPLPTESARIPQGEKMTPAMLAECSFGQGALLVTPLQLTLLVAAIANGGVMVEPYLVESRESRVQSPESRVLPADIANQVRDLMVAVVDEGTGRPARIAGVKVAGKTGTAENPQGPPHAWFLAFAPADSPQVAVGVIVENAGWGATVAAPIARRLVEAVLGR